MMPLPHEPTRYEITSIMPVPFEMYGVTERRPTHEPRAERLVALAVIRLTYGDYDDADTRDYVCPVPANIGDVSPGTDDHGSASAICRTNWLWTGPATSGADALRFAARTT